MAFGQDGHTVVRPVEVETNQLPAGASVAPSQPSGADVAGRDDHASRRDDERVGLHQVGVKGGLVLAVGEGDGTVDASSFSGVRFDPDAAAVLERKAVGQRRHLVVAERAEVGAGRRELVDAEVGRCIDKPASEVPDRRDQLILTPAGDLSSVGEEAQPLLCEVVGIAGAVARSDQVGDRTEPRTAEVDGDVAGRSIPGGDHHRLVRTGCDDAWSIEQRWVWCDADHLSYGSELTVCPGRDRRVRSRTFDDRGFARRAAINETRRWDHLCARVLGAGGGGRSRGRGGCRRRGGCGRRGKRRRRRRGQLGDRRR